MTPVKSMKIEAHMEEESRGRQNVVMRSFEDGKQAMRANMLIDPRRRNVEMELNYDEGIVNLGMWD